MSLLLVLVVMLGQSPEDGGAPVVLTPDAGTPPQRESVVVGERLTDVRRVAGSAQVIGGEELERQEANDLHRVLSGVPGVYVREEDGVGLRPNLGMRGVNADRSSKVTLLEDGVLFGPSPYSAPATYFVPLSTRLVGVEVFKGPAAIRFGPQTIGGAVNLRTRQVPEQSEADLDAALGSYGLGKLHGVAGTGAERWGVLAEAVHLSSDGFKRLDGGGGTGFERNEVMLKGRYRGEAAGRVRHAFELKLGYSTEDSTETYLGLSEPDFAQTPYRRYAASANDRMLWARTQGQLSHTLQVDEALRVVTTAYRHDFHRTWTYFSRLRTGPAMFEALAFPREGANALVPPILSGEEDSVGEIIIASNGRAYVSQGLQSVASWVGHTGPLGHELELGARFHHDEVRRHHTAAAWDLQRGTLLRAASPTEVTAQNLAFTRSVSLHLSDTVALGRLLLAPGARLEVIESGTSDQLKGKRGAGRVVVPLLGLGAVYGFASGLSVLAGVHQGFSPPAAGQADAQAERALNSEAGLRYARRGVRLEAIGFWSEYSNITGACTASTGCPVDELNQQFNGGAARVLGLEALVGLKGRAAGLQLGADLSYTFTRAHFLGDFRSDNPIWGQVRAGDELPYVPQHQGQARVRAARGPFELGLGATYYGELRELAGQGPPVDGVRVPGRWLLDATASAEVGAARLYFTATNLLNEPALVARRPFGARPQAPFQAQVGLKYSLR